MWLWITQISPTSAYAYDYSKLHHNRISQKSLMMGPRLVLMLKGYLWFWIWTGIVPPWASIIVVYMQRGDATSETEVRGQEGSATLSTRSFSFLVNYYISVHHLLLWLFFIEPFIHPSQIQDIFINYVKCTRL